MTSPSTSPHARPALAMALCALMFVDLAGAAEQLLPAAGALPAPACKLAIANEPDAANLAHYRGQVVYVDFWASWCGPCRQSFPFMNQLHSQLGDKGLAVLAINLDEEAEDAQRFLASHPAQFRVAGGANQACASAFQVEAMPSSYLVDRNGRVRYIHHGFRAGDGQRLQELAARLVAEPATTP